MIGLVSGLGVLAIAIASDVKAVHGINARLVALTFDMTDCSCTTLLLSVSLLNALLSKTYPTE
ncbi:hypothetical protein EZMO1_3472 [Endozoicomonas montiporae CL-33]|uniref:Uncharacterized protein n=1 Tax=Endozoicomonas montiporae CL-33 TaxID=570277 RepID=A0A142BFD4_9GAMM|nr:hypothetical protein [Endozoicomonas montiporae]AMO57460.1 hypothetical protein EZMO1_3472 [Endozoicomonas montiporae CL-33]